MNKNGTLFSLSLCAGFLVLGCSNASPDVDFLYRARQETPSPAIENPGSSHVHVGNPTVNYQATTTSTGSGTSYKASISAQNSIIQSSTSANGQYQLQVFEAAVE